jgi:hypothetical protein
MGLPLTQRAREFRITQELSVAMYGSSVTTQHRQLDTTTAVRSPRPTGSRLRATVRGVGEVLVTLGMVVLCRDVELRTG